MSRLNLNCCTPGGHVATRLSLRSAPAVRRTSQPSRPCSPQQERGEHERPQGTKHSKTSSTHRNKQQVLKSQSTQHPKRSQRQCGHHIHHPGGRWPACLRHCPADPNAALPHCLHKAGQLARCHQNRGCPEHREFVYKLRDVQQRRKPEAAQATW